ncbi:hypothetical protein BSKO_11919 [Bryopsis sp. KO-2023]|nr:hypothetical protein BSKO_11919 [Bryopsis sp. KO-2023]
MSGDDEYYYDTDDAFNFYQELWGGRNLHLGHYPVDYVPSVECVLEASDKSMNYLIDTLAPALTPGENGTERRKAVDMGSAYGGCARAMATRFGCEVLCVDMSVRENEICRKQTKEANLDHLVKCPTELSFLDTGAPDESMDAVFSMDSFLHAGAAVMKEVARVLKPGGIAAFTDPMRSDGVSKAKLHEVFKRVPGLENMGTPSGYVTGGTEHGLRLHRFEDRTDDMARHYAAVHSVLENARDKGTLQGKVSDAFIAKMLSGLKTWSEQAYKRNLTWGLMVFIKPVDTPSA